jgi:hypothetical protein
VTSAERYRVRGLLREAGFRRTGHTDDDGHGEYEERYAHDDGSTLVLKWARRNMTGRPEDDLPGVVAPV